MIDTICIYFDCFIVSPQNKLEIKTYNSSNQAFFFYLSDGKPIIANLVRYFSKKNDIRIIFTPEKLHGSKLFITFEVSKIFSSHNLIETNFDHLQKAILFVHNLLEEIGVKADLPSLKISRLDLFKDIKTVLSINDINRLFMKYFKKVRKSQIIDYENGNLEFRNKKFGFIIYDKAKQLEYCHGLKVCIPKNKYLIRFEIRFRSHAKVLSSFKRFNIKSEIDIFGDEQDYKKLELIFSEFFEHHFFENVSMVSSSNCSTINEANFAKEKGCRLSEFIKLQGIRKIIQEKSFYTVCKIFTYGTNTEKIQISNIKRSYLTKAQKYGLISRAELEQVIILWNSLFENSNSAYHIARYQGKHFRNVWYAEKHSNIASLFHKKEQPEYLFESNSEQVVNE